jgi:hypothetical protein
MPHFERGELQRPPPRRRPKPEPSAPKEEKRSKGTKITPSYSIAEWAPSEELEEFMNDMMPDV